MTITGKQLLNSISIPPRWAKTLLQGRVARSGGAEVEVGEITFPGKSPGGGHVHQTNEIFYVLSGRMEHIVNGESAVLDPGMIGIVRKGDTVSHKILSEKPCKALVIWAPGGEADRLARIFQVKPIAE